MHSGNRLCFGRRSAFCANVPRPNQSSELRSPAPCQFLRQFRGQIRSRCQAAVLDPPSKKDAEVEEEEEEDFEDLETPDLEDAGLTSQQVKDLMNVVCHETDFAEVSVKIAGFAIKARRKPAASAVGQITQAGADSTATTFPAPVPAVEQPFQSTASIDESQILQPPPMPTSSHSSMDEDDYDENLLYLGAPKVGILRRGRYVKGRKIGKGPVAEEGARVKKGQPLAFIEQLGTYVAVEAPQAGEIAAFKIEDGTAVEYKEVIAEISPFFGGHIIGDKKYA